MNKRGKILIIDDNEDVLFALNALLIRHVEKVKVSTRPENIARYMQEFVPDVILLDMNFDKEIASGKEGFAWLERILKSDSKAIVILMTAYADTAKAVHAIKMGATDFIPKPWENDKLLATINSALQIRQARDEAEELKRQLGSITSEHPVEIIGESDKMQEIFGIIDRMADTEANILILGENGTGKDIIARSIHNNSPRAGRVFASIDLGSISESIFESELFGYEKGAFTDAKREKQGRIEVASGGTLFLDEIANLSSAMQAKLLTAIEKRQIIRLGSVYPLHVDVRFIAATNADIYKATDNGTFRQDLLYRINTIEIYIPPLRERGEDIILLAEHFMNRFCQKYKKDIRAISGDVKRRMLSYPWPGNVRELQNVVERAVILSTGKLLQLNDFSISNGTRYLKSAGSEILNLEQLEEQAVAKALDMCEGNMNRAAEILGISRFALYRKINKK